MTVPPISDSGESPFTKPEMEEVSYGTPPIWVAALGVLGLVVSLVTWALWWLA